VYLKHVTSLQFLTYLSFFAVLLAAMFRFRARPYAADPRRARTPTRSCTRTTARRRSTSSRAASSSSWGACTWCSKNLPWVSEYLARTGDAGHLVRDLSNTHLMIVGGGTLLATGLCWLALPRVVGRPLASEGLAQCAFWFTVAGLVGLLRLADRQRHRDGPADRARLELPGGQDAHGQLVQGADRAGRRVMGLGYWCFATNVA
jgi:hypothetical protein